MTLLLLGGLFEERPADLFPVSGLVARIGLVIVRPAI